MGALSIALGAAGVGILALTPELATLEDLFFRLTEGGADGARSRERRVERRHPGGRLGAPRRGDRHHTALERGP